VLFHKNGELTADVWFYIWCVCVWCVCAVVSELPTSGHVYYSILAWLANMSLFVVLHRNVLCTSLNICQTFAQTHIIHISLPEICNYLYTQKRSFQCLGNKVFLCGGYFFLSSCAILGKKWIWKHLPSSNSQWMMIPLYAYKVIPFYFITQMFACIQ